MSQDLKSQHTGNFPEALQQLGISIVVSTYQAGKLILMRNDNGVLNTHFIAMEKPMGMALNNNRLSVGSGPQVWDYYNMNAVAAKLEPPGKHDACFIPRAMHITGDIDIHEMAFDKQQRLWLVNTRMSCLCTLDREYSVVPEWRPPFISAYDLTDRCHLNGLAMKDGKPFIVSALGTTDTAGGWRANKAAGGMLMDIATGEYIAQGLSMPHSPRWYRNKLWVLESGAGTLAEVNPNTGERDVIVELPGFTRGLDFVGQYAIIGLSQVRETAVFAGLPLTERVAERQCGVWIVDIEQRQSVAWVVFTGGVQEIFAVQALAARFPSLLETDDPLIRNSYALPDQALTDLAAPDPIQQQLENASQHHQKKQWDKAVPLYRELLQQQPDHVNAWFQLGLAYNEQELWTEAIDSFQHAIAHLSSHAEAYNSLGHAYAHLGDYKQALDSYSKAISTDKKFATAYFNRGLISLMLGDFKAGWDDYEWRWQMPNFTPFNCSQPQWQGEDISDKTLLVYTEQGNGDAIQFARFLPEVRKRCQRLMLVCTEPLRQLFQAMNVADEVRLPGELPAGSFDVYIPIMSLAGVLQVGSDTIPQHTPYLSVPAHIQVPQLTGSAGFKVGLVWSGSNTHKGDKNRSCPLDEMLSLTDVKGIDFYSLQVPLPTEQRQLLQEHNVHDLETELVSYAHTAAYLDQLDLVISVDTSVPHLSAAMNIPTWLLVPVYGEWRWQLDREDSPWYPSMRLFRHQGTGNWAELISRVKQALQQQV